MADVTIDVDNKNSQELYAQGVKAYILCDYTSAVEALGKAAELIVAEHGNETHETLGDVYLYYGKALLSLTRQESALLGESIPNNKEQDVSEDEDEEPNDESEKEEIPNSTTDVAAEKQTDELEKPTDEPEKSSDDPEKVEEEEEPSDIQIAWETLELAKKIFENTDKSKLCEVHTTLGEISMENGDFDGAIKDFKIASELAKELNNKRKIAEIYYNYGISLAALNEIKEDEQPIEYFNLSLNYLKQRIDELKLNEADNKDEIKEIEELIPELMEKISDTENIDKEKKTVKEMLIKLMNDDKKEVSTSTSTEVKNISHLVRRKRKLEDNDTDENPSKKST